MGGLVVVRYALAMHLPRARARNGRYEIDEVSRLPEGTEVELVRLDELDATDELDDEERARLHSALDAGLVELNAGHRVDAAAVLTQWYVRQLF